jgi:glycosyltransferase involved in cell wall biosynthesis
MKKILILAYFYPPFNHISSQRPKSFAEHFSKCDLYPIVITRHFNETGKTYEDSYKANTKDLEISEKISHTEIRLPYFGKRYRTLQKFKKILSSDRLLLSGYAVFGNLHVKTGISELAIDFLRNYLNENKVDYILATTPPLNSIELGYKLSKEFEIPMIVDFRDLWDNHILNENYRPNLAKSLQNKIETTYLKKWLGKAALVTAVSEPLLEAVRKIKPNIETMVVMNGFEQNSFDEFSEIENKKCAKFTFSVIGTIYPQQDLSILFEGLKMFLADKNLDEIQLNFIGTAYISEVGATIENNLPHQCANITERVSHTEALKKLFESDVLFYPGWKGYRGIVSGKIFEYLGSKKKILIAPSDNDVMEKLITETKAGKVANSAAQFADALNGWFNEWKASGKIPYSGNYVKVLEYSRENQAANLAKKIISL